MLVNVVQVVVEQLCCVDLIIIGVGLVVDNVLMYVDIGDFVLCVGCFVLVVLQVYVIGDFCIVVVVWIDMWECCCVVMDVLFIFYNVDCVIFVEVSSDLVVVCEVIEDIVGWFCCYCVCVDWIVLCIKGLCIEMFVVIVDDVVVDFIVVGVYGYGWVCEWVFGGVICDLLLYDICCKFLLY